MTRSYPDETEFALFLSCNGNSLEHLEIMIHGPSDPTPHAYALSRQALPSLRILAVYSLDTIFRNFSGFRNLTHLKLGSNQGLDHNVASDLQKYADQLVSVTTFACSLQHPEISQLARMLPNLERLDVRIVPPKNIDMLMGDALGLYVWPTDAPGRRSEGGRLKNLKVLRVTSTLKVYSDTFVPWAFAQFPTLQSLELPHLSHLEHHIHCHYDGRRHVQSLYDSYDFIPVCNLFYRFGNATAMPSLVKWHCREMDVEVIMESIERSRYQGRPGFI